MDRAVVRVPLSPVEAARLNARDSRVSASAWAVQLIDHDVRCSGTIRPIEHLSRTDTEHFVSVSIPANLRDSVERRRGCLPLADYVRAVITTGQAQPRGQEQLRASRSEPIVDDDVPRGWERHGEFFRRKLNYCVKLQDVVEEKPGVIYGILIALRENGRTYAPPILLTHEFDFATCGRVSSWATAAEPGERLDVLVGYDEERDCVLPLRPDEVRANWRFAWDQLCRLPIRRPLFVTPTTYFAATPGEPREGRAEYGTVFILSLEFPI